MIKIKQTIFQLAAKGACKSRSNLCWQEEEEEEEKEQNLYIAFRDK